MVTTAAGTQAGSRHTARRRPELLAPAGNEAIVRAAVENGADAVYFGLQTFNARLRAENIALEDLPRIVGWLHERGVKCYVTLNTLVFCKELQEAARALIACSDAGVDGVLVQDIGLALLAASLVPDLPLHASTQMTLTAAESVRATEVLGLRLSRVVAARECSKRELRRMRESMTQELEVFVHGALCVAYSGQCLTSEALGGRSANRGECAQACRLPYTLVVDGRARDLGDVQYLLSPKDLAAYEDLGELVAIGIDGFKIEGRLKSAEYVAATVQVYRRALDSVLSGDASPHVDLATRRTLEQVFSRGFTGGYLHAIDHQAVVEGRFPKKRGIFLGYVRSVQADGVVVRVEGPLKPGDGVVFDAGRPDSDEEGGRVYALFDGKRKVSRFEPEETPGGSRELLLTFARGQINTARIRTGDRVWKTSDPEMESTLRATYQGEAIRYRRPLRAIVSGRPGEPLRVVLEDGIGHTVEVIDTEPAQPARDHPLTREALRVQLGRLGNTPFFLAELEVQLDGHILVPYSRLNALRRKAVTLLLQERRKMNRQRRRDPEALNTLRQRLACGDPSPEVAAETRLAVLCRTLEQVQAAVQSGLVCTVYTDFEEIRLHQQARALVPPGGPGFWPATLRVTKPGEAPMVRKLLEVTPDGVLVRSLAAWYILRETRPDLSLAADYTLNIANDLSARLLRQHSLDPLVPSYDLNIDQLLDLVRATPPSWYEVTIHQHMPMFHMEHCVFCRFLTTGTDASNCGRPCERHQIALRDRVGFEHPVLADAGCRNTVFNAVAQSASRYLDPLLRAGLRRFRVDLVRESAATTHQVLEIYAAALRGEIDGREVWRQLAARSKLGVTRGTLDHE